MGRARELPAGPRISPVDFAPRRSSHRRPFRTGSGPVATRTYTSAATYPVTLTVKDEYGVSSAVATRTVTIVEPRATPPRRR